MLTKYRLPIVAVATVVALMWWGGTLLEGIEARRYQEEVRGEVQHQLNALRTGLESQISGSLLLSRGLVVHIASHPDITQEEFTGLARGLIAGLPQVRNIGLARDNIITHVYPLKNNAAAIGLDYMRYETQRDAVLRAIDSALPVVAGPVKLVQGGRAFIIRNPVWQTSGSGELQSGPYWGIVSVVLDVDPFLAAAGLHALPTSVQVAIRGTDAKGAQGEVFYGDPELFRQHPVLMNVPLPVGSWQLAAVPTNGWSPPSPNLWRLRIAEGGVTLLVAVMMFFATRNLQRRLESERQFKKMFVGHGAIMLLVDAASLRIADANLAAERFYRYPHEKLLEMSITDLSTSSEEIVRNYLDHSDEEGGVELRSIHRLAEGEEREVEVHSTAIDDPLGRRLHFLVLHDITDRSRAEERMREAITSAERASQAKSQFLANMSHEIRTPMNAILGMAELLAESELSDTQRHYVRIFRNAGQNLLELINDILDIAKLESGQITLRREPLDLWELLEQQMELMRISAEGRGLELELRIAPEVSRWHVGDSQKLRQTLLNLLGNAVKFTSQGSITVSVAPSADGHRDRFNFAVADTGRGIPAEQQKTIFQAFIQADGTISRRHGGSGLGLTISRRFVELMGGTLRVESEEGKGSTFSFTIDLPTTTPAPDTKSHAATNQEQELLLRHPMRILLAEDSPDNVLLIDHYLKGSPHRLEVAGDGREAVEKFRHGHFDLVLMDIQMPGMDGLTATRQIRGWEAQKDLPHTPIVALTAHALVGDDEKSLDAGCDRHLTKPIRKRVLLEVIEEYAQAERVSNA